MDIFKAADLGPVRATMGALLVGVLVSVFLSGIVSMQVYLYVRVYPSDRKRLKSIVWLIWFMDFAHTVMVCIASWLYLIEGFGDRSDFDYISWSIGVTIALTAIVTFLVHCFFTHRIYVVSKGKKLITSVLAILACVRLAAAILSTSEMIILASFRQFVQHYGWAFTMGLSTAVGLDVLITMALCHYLRESKSGFASMNEIIDTLILYTVETGLITCVATIISLICWLTMPYNLIFLTLHFTICKLYANSFLATLNSRATLRARSQSTSSTDKDGSLPMMISGASRRPSATFMAGSRPPRPSIEFQKALHVKIEQSVSREVDGEITEINFRSYEDASPVDSICPPNRRARYASDVIHIA